MPSRCSRVRRPAVGSERLLAWACGLLASFLLACTGGLRVTRINSEQRKPNNVWVFFTVERGGEPVPGLTAESFRIYEDDSLVSIYESQQVIQNPEVAAVMYTLLLLDVSGSITESGSLDALVDAAELFTERVGKTQKVAVYAFDGSSEIHPIVPFTQTEGALKGGLNGLRKYKAKDPSTNLNGAVVQGLQRLKKDLARDRRPLKFGTLVVFSDGADRAARVTREAMLRELRELAYADFQRFAIGIGDEAEMERARLQDIGRDGTERGDDRDRVKGAFDAIAKKIEQQSKRFYLLSYCTPARRGEHTVRIEVHEEDLSGTGALEYRFDAEGFGPPPACDPQRKPTFRLDKVDAKPSLEIRSP